MEEFKVDLIRGIRLIHIEGRERGQGPTVGASHDTTVETTHGTQASHGEQQTAIVRISQINAPVTTIRANTIMKGEANKFSLEMIDEIEEGNACNVRLNIPLTNINCQICQLTPRLGSAVIMAIVSAFAEAIPSSTVPSNRSGPVIVGVGGEVLGAGDGAEVITPGVGRLVRGLGVGRFVPPPPPPASTRRRG